MSEKGFAAFESSLEELGKYLNYLGKSGVVNSNALAACQKDIAETEQMMNEYKDPCFEAMLTNKRRILEWMQELQMFSESQEIEFDFVILQTKQFSSGFSKEAFSNIQIEFPGFKRTRDFESKK